MPESITQSTEAVAPAPDLSQPLTQAPPATPAFNDAFSDLDKLVETVPDKAPVKAEKATPSENPVAKPLVKPAEPSEKKSPEPLEKKVAEPADKKLDAAEKSGKRSPWQVVHDKEAEIATLRKENEALKSSKPNGEWQKERADLLKRIEDRDTRLREREEEIQFAAFEQSDKFKSEYDKPYSNAWNAGRMAVARFKVTDSEGGERPAKPEDFDRLMQLEQSDPEAAATLLGEMFGNKASYVAAHMVKVKESFQRIQDARDEYRTRADEDRKTKSAQTEKETKELSETFEFVRNGAAEKYPDLFAAPDDDAPGKELLGKGEHFANRVFSNGQPVADGDKQLTKSQKSALDAVAWQKLRAFDLQVSRRQKAEARVKELQSELDQYKKSVPGPGDGGAGKSGEGDVPDWEKQLGDMAA